jgi:hypothetical protein
VQVGGVEAPAIGPEADTAGLGRLNLQRMHGCQRPQLLAHQRLEPRRRDGEAGKLPVGRHGRKL